MPAAAAERPEFSYLPFGGGARRCVGDRLAMMEMQLVIATVAQRFRFSPLGSRPIEPVVTLRPRYEVPLAIRAR